MGEGKSEDSLVTLDWTEDKLEVREGRTEEAVKTKSTSRIQENEIGDLLLQREAWRLWAAAMSAAVHLLSRH